MERVVKNLQRTFVILTVLIGGPVLAEEHQHSQQGSTAPEAAHEGNADRMSMMNNMRTMREQMEQIRRTTDPKERERLMQEHMRLMMGQMKMMGSMRNSMMQQAAPGEDASTRLDLLQHGFEMLADRLNLLEDVVNQVFLEQQEMMQIIGMGVIRR